MEDAAGTDILFNDLKSMNNIDHYTSLRSLYCTPHAIPTAEILLGNNIKTT